MKPRLAMAALLVAGAFPVITLLSRAAPAFAYQSVPHLDPAFYVTHIDYSLAQTLGCNEGSKDSQSAFPNSEVVLDFGAQASDNTRVLLTKSTNSATYAQVEQYAENFKQGFYSCSGSNLLDLDIGTNNSTGACCTTAMGQAWAQIVRDVANWNSWMNNVIVRGANDIEQWANPQYGFPGYSYQPAFTWEGGFAPSGVLYVNFGSADGCPSAIPTPGGAGGVCSNWPAYWDQHAYWYLSYGAPAALAMPEIYVDGPPHEWAAISWYGSVNQSTRIFFDGPLDQYPLGCCFTALQAWNSFWGAINYWPQTQSDMLFSEEIYNA